MKLLAVSAVVIFLPGVSAGGIAASPVGKALQLLSDLQAKIIKEGEAAQKIYAEYTEWCEDRSRSLTNEIKTGKSEIAELSATIAKQESVIGELGSKVERLAGDISTDQSDLKAAREIRDKETKLFQAEQKELMNTVDVLRRAISILDREIKGGASMAQLQGANNFAQALNVLVDAAMLSTADATKVSSLIQSSDEDGSSGAPAAAAYENHSEGIVDTLTDLLDKAEEQLDAARKTETSNLHGFEMMELGLKDEVKNAEKELAESKQNSAAAGEQKSVAEGDLSVSQKELKTDASGLSELHHECMSRAEDFERETKSRGEELGALDAAKKALNDNVGAAEELSYGSTPSFLQISDSDRSPQFESARFVRKLAHAHASAELAQLAAKMSSAISFSSMNGEDPFAKVKGLLQDMVAKLEKEAEADASQKAFCDKEMSETSEKKDIKANELEKLTTQIDKMSSRSKQLKEEVAALQKSLAQLTKAQAEMDKIRLEEAELFKQNKKDMEQGLHGVRLALKVLGEYYASSDKSHSSADGAGTGIIGLLEVVESDFTKGLAEATATEESAQSTYENESKENEIEKTTKHQDVKYKSKESTELDQAASETNSDRDNTQSELDAVLEYWTKISKQCVAKAETFEERQSRFKAEIEGLRDAQQILESQTAFVQQSRRSRVLRGSKQFALSAA